MGYKIVFISYPVRGPLYSTQRYADLKAVRQILSDIRKGNLERVRKGECEVLPIAPYLLYAECVQDVAEARARLVGWEHNPPHTAWLYGEPCDEMEEEIASAPSYMCMPCAYNEPADVDGPTKLLEAAE